MFIFPHVYILFHVLCNCVSPGIQPGNHRNMDYDTWTNNNDRFWIIPSGNVFR